MKSFLHRLLPAKKNSGLRMADYWVWCGSVIRATKQGEDGRFHMFAARFPRHLSREGYWTTHYEIVRASSDTPDGPYQFESRVLPPRDPRFFDGRVTCNPCIRFFRGRYYLYYVGITYDFDPPTPDNPIREPEPAKYSYRWRKAWESKRIGLAVADSVLGPWTRVDRPLIEPRPGKWDAMITSNPSIAIRDDGYTLLVYKSRPHWEAPFNIAFAHAPTPEGPFERLSDGPAFSFDCEDPCIWFEGGRYHLIVKDFHGTVCGESYAGIYLSSPDGRDWKLGEPPLAYSCTIGWDDGTSTDCSRVERPSVLLDGGRATHVCFAVNDEGIRFQPPPYSRNIVVPLRPLSETD